MILSKKTLTLSFSPHHQATGIHVSPNTPISEIVKQLFREPQTKAINNNPWSHFIQYFFHQTSPLVPEPTAQSLSPPAVIVLNGGTAQLESELQQQLALVLQEGLAQFAAQEQITLITGGTEAGIFSLLGQGLEKWEHKAPCIGVCVDNLVAWQPPLRNLTDNDKRVPLEPHHSHFILVTGNHWGDELKMMSDLSEYLSQQCPLITIFAGGGEMTLHEMQNAVANNRQMILLKGSGRITDNVLAAQRGEQIEDERLQAIAQQGQIISYPLAKGARALQTLLREVLF